MSPISMRTGKKNKKSPTETQTETLMQTTGVMDGFLTELNHPDVLGTNPALALMSSQVSGSQMQSYTT